MRGWIFQRRLLNAAIDAASSQFSCSRGFASRRQAEIALLIDGDHVAPAALEPLLFALSEHGRIGVKRFYTVAHKAELWATTLQAYDIEPVVVPRWAGGKKDAADMVMALDAAELALQPQESVLGRSDAHKLTGIAVASDDLDFALLLMRIRTWGLMPFAVTPSSDGSVHCSVQRVWRDAGAVIVPYMLKKRHCKKSIVFEEGSFKAAPIPEELQPVTVSENRYNEMLTLFKKLGYVPVELNRLPMASVAKFLHVNKLGPCAVLPRWLMEHHLSAILEVDNKWLMDPGNLVVLDRIKKGENNDTMRSLRAGGPVLLHVGPMLVQDVLRHLGFLDEGSKIVLEAELLDAIGAFLIVNGQRMAKDHGLCLDESNVAEISCKLHELFAAQLSQQRWRIMLSDGTIRRKLHSNGYISDSDAPQAAVLLGMRRFLEQRGVMNADKLRYQRAVLECVAVMRRKNPESRV